LTPSRYFGLIPAAGAGARFGAAGEGQAPHEGFPLPKQYRDIAGRPMLLHAVEALLAAPEIDTLFVVLTPGDERFRRMDLGALGRRVEPLYCGGPTRRDTVLNGLVATASVIEADDWVLVHDAARPCLAAADLRRLIDGVACAEDSPGGLLAVRVADTLKRGDERGRVLATESRENLWQAQTPQMFRYGTLLAALRESPGATDEAQAVERLGARPLLVEGSARNFKVTYGPDLELAALLLQTRRG
jgi:2-C-methyl-D-erythritol 4-phosphate cytidylyltransferase